jgi:hypothetical protein
MDDRDHPTGALFADGPWPRLERMRYGPFPCRDVTGPNGVFDDPRTLLHVTPGFDSSQAFLVIVFFHGWCATLTRRIGGGRYHVVETYRLIEQIDASGLNAVLVAPQFARDADAGLVPTPGHPGRFGERHGFSRFLKEAMARIALQRGEQPARYRRAPVLLISFSGGYRAAASVLTEGGVSDQVIGFIGLDTIYGETEAFVSWFAASHRQAFLAAVYTGGQSHDHASAGPTLRLAQSIAALPLPDVDVLEALPARFAPGVAAFQHVGDPDLHLDLVAAGWPGFDRPVRRLLARVAGFPRQR